MTTKKRVQLARHCLQGLAIGDAFGESFFGDTNTIRQHLATRTSPATTWEYTDDTVMAIAVYQQLVQRQSIDQDAFVQALVRCHQADPNRGYGATARRILRGVGEGGNWRDLAAAVFDGMGSMGNGAAMRVGPIGAYYYDDWKRVKSLAEASAAVTHAHTEAKIGAIAIALATALATQSKEEQQRLSAEAFLTKIHAQLPPSDTTSKINKALHISAKAHRETLKTVLGNGSRMLAQDTVPFVLWCAAHHLYDYEAALWKAVSMVGGIVSMSCAATTLPKTWQNAVEDINNSVFMAVALQ